MANVFVASQRFRTLSDWVAKRAICTFLPLLPFGEIVEIVDRSAKECLGGDQKLRSRFNRESMTDLDLDGMAQHCIREFKRAERRIGKELFSPLRIREVIKGWSAGFGSGEQPFFPRVVSSDFKIEIVILCILMDRNQVSEDEALRTTGMSSPEELRRNAKDQVQAIRQTPAKRQVSVYGFIVLNWMRC